MASLEIDVPALAKQYGGADGLKQRVATLIPADRGTRFAGDTANVALYIERSKNKNIVCYAAQYEKGAGNKELDAKAPVDAYWLDIDPEYVKASREKGKLDDREELNLIDRTMAYGHSASEPIVSVEGLVFFTLSFVALSSRKMQFFLASDQQQPAMLCVIGGEPSIAVRIYVKAKEPKHFWNLPTVEYVELFGISIASGQPTYEKLEQ